MDEFELIDRYFAALGAERDDVELGVGDDAALLRPPADRRLVLAVDTIVEGVHFPARTAAADVGHRALAVNLSDLAAMGAEPAWALLAMTLPAADPEWVAAFARGLDALARAHGVAVVGGDTTSGPALTVSVTVAGSVAPGRALTRRGARPGDLVAVSGTPGDAGAGLALLLADRPAGGSGAQRALVERFLRPAPRLACGAALRGRATAAIDLSDGLLGDAGKLGRASGVRLELQADRLPLSAPLREVYAGREGEALRCALTGGDDYELLFTLPPDAAARLPAAAERAGCELTLIGEVVAPTPARPPGAVVLRDGAPVSVDAAGYRHFP